MSDDTADHPLTDRALGAGGPVPAGGAAASESVELIRAFLAIADARDRAAVIALAQRLAAASPPPRPQPNETDTAG